MSPAVGHATHMAVHECYCVHMHLKAQLAQPCPSRSKGKVDVVVPALLALIPPMGPVGRLKRRGGRRKHT